MQAGADRWHAYLFLGSITAKMFPLSIKVFDFLLGVGGAGAGQRYDSSAGAKGAALASITSTDVPGSEQKVAMLIQLERRLSQTSFLKEVWAVALGEYY